MKVFMPTGNTKKIYSWVVAIYLIYFVVMSAFLWLDGGASYRFMEVFMIGTVALIVAQLVLIFQKISKLKRNTIPIIISAFDFPLHEV